ncbi:valine--tRNA ligase [Helcobacillus massiliensis]|uniref:valine--tRNA ligase n=1 Tax=Helcobacillus massiliensis TaxID=521392 RepID=UPI0021A3739F|nr:valine--tRNA ligase [Helcobacillus massiliensis]MCT1557938.1 valine--tRNA ligase [Helcobacillus massiliensis]MCT2037337.1 valine--tRNA ligase [Helcobacillus massiliensis]MCT2332940.1 valine--tRNA ligase [Helcobacillus massiliensis]
MSEIDSRAGHDSAASAPAIPAKPSLEGLEEKWDQNWTDSQVFAFDPDTTRSEVFSIDTPPPTASGSLHIGHVFAYSQSDIIARYQRMTGKNVFFPMGWDDNGLPTERRVQNYYGVRCDPSLPYEEGFEPPHRGGNAQTAKPQNQQPISRRNFIELCLELTGEDEKAFEHVFRTLGLSVDWGRLTYQTINAKAQATSQKAFLDHVASGHAYQAEAPTPWDTTFRTAVAQAEQEDQDRPGAYHRVGFTKPDGEKVFIETTRPELLPACVALVAHPDDERYQDLFGTTVTSPLFDVEVPVKAHELAQMDKGAGIAMICTFGDATDVIWWRELDLPTRAVIGRDGRFIPEAEWITSEEGAAHYAEVAGATVFTAQKRIVEKLTASGDLVGEPKRITHPVKFYEKGDKPLEYVTSRQWYISNGGRDTNLRAELITRGEELEWFPPFMESRYRNWVENLTGDWLVSRQRYFGVPIPVWYGVAADGSPDYDTLLTPSAEQLPIDPTLHVPEGFTEEQRDQPGGFTADRDILDTWATSSLTPLLVTDWLGEQDILNKVYPFDLRPQGHDIIRTWLFSTVVRSHLLTDSLPWKGATINGWILDPDRKKMSKSKGNVVTPIDLLEQYGSDGVRYWAARARQGADTAFEEGQMKIGRRLAIKVLNASKFALGFGEAPSDPAGVLAADPAAVTEALDRSMLAALADVVEQASTALAKHDYARALEVIEPFFWTFCDDFIELVKSRAHGHAGEEAALSARAALTIALDVQLRLFAPYLPFATDEVWSWWRTGSVHAQAWPQAAPLREAAGTETGELLDVVSAAIIVVRKVKSDAKVSQRTPLLRAALHVPAAQVELLRRDADDVCRLGSIEDLTIEAIDEGAEDQSIRVEGAELGEPPAKRPRN